MCDAPGTAGNCKLVLVRAPFDVGRCTIDAQQDKGRLPDQVASLGIRSLLPDIRVTILSRCDNAVGVGSPVDGGDLFVVLVDDE